MTRKYSLFFLISLAACQTTGNPAPVPGAAEELRHHKIRVEGSGAVIRLYDQAPASFASKTGAWSAAWSIEQDKLCFSAPHDTCYQIEKRRGRWYRATPQNGGRPQNWFVQKHLDEEGNTLPHDPSDG